MFKKKTISSHLSSRVAELKGEGLNLKKGMTSEEVNANVKLLKKKGFSLMEVVLVLTLAGAAIIGVISSFNASNKAQDAQTEVSNVISLSNTVRSMFKAQGSYEGITNEIVLTDASFPQQMRGLADGNIRTGWADDGYDLDSEDLDGIPFSAFKITMNEVDLESCVTITSKAYVSFRRVIVGGTIINGVATANTACSGAAGTGAGAAVGTGDIGTTTIEFYNN